MGGELRLTEEHYIDRLRESIRACLGMLKRNRWFSVVFQHWNVRYFEAILEEAARSGADLRAAVTQTGDTIWSMHKKKNRERVLAGEMIFTFCKMGAAFPVVRSSTPILTSDQLMYETLSEVSPDGRPFAGELLFNRMILKAWQRGALQSLDITRQDFAELLTRKGWRYNNLRNLWFQASEPAPATLQFSF